MRKEDWQAAFGQPSASFDARFQQTLSHLDETEEKKMKRASFRAVAIALALLVGLTGAAYAATQGWLIGDYMGKRAGSTMPENFLSGYQKDYTQELCGIRFHIRDAYVNGDTLIALTEISRADGSPALFLTDGLDEECPISSYDQTISWEANDTRTIAQYAQDNGLPVYLVGNHFAQQGNDEITYATGDEWAEDDYRFFVSYLQIPGFHVENGMTTVQWHILVRDENGQLIEQEMDVTLPADEAETWEVEVNRQIEDLPITIKKLYLAQSRIDLQVDIEYEMDREQMSEEEKELFKWDVYFEFFDPGTDEKLPYGTRRGGVTQKLNEERTLFLRKVDSIYSGFTGDTLALKVYDGYRDAYIASLTVKIR